MIKVFANIIIDSDIEKVWSFINNISLGLSYNKFHRKINIKNCVASRITQRLAESKSY